MRTKDALNEKKTLCVCDGTFVNIASSSSGIVSNICLSKYIAIKRHLMLNDKQNNCLLFYYGHSIATPFKMKIKWKFVWHCVNIEFVIFIWNQFNRRVIFIGTFACGQIHARTRTNSHCFMCRLKKSKRERQKGRTNLCIKH